MHFPIHEDMFACMLTQIRVLLDFGRLDLGPVGLMRQGMSCTRIHMHMSTHIITHVHIYTQRHS